MQEGSLCLQSFAGDTEDGKSTLKKEEKEQKLDNFFFQRSYQGLSRLLNYIMYIPFGMIRVSCYCDFKQTIMNKNIMICTNSGSF
jgi:hypothetical protein